MILHRSAPLYLHRLRPGDVLPEDRLAVIDEGDEVTVISGRAGGSGPYARITLGPFRLDLVGIMARASSALAREGIPIFVISSYRYDHILVPLERAEEAVRCLASIGLDED
ncbi:MAG: hypothetical protein A4E29_01054 [Methanomassiliicoccales archaeon PtaB.Bin134]|nr:MAG: hypothetical protein A4E29_01054 [Methanomassiliicoccales archaeon PtaB.Bin134]